jgi:hypothetical protein
MTAEPWMCKCVAETHVMSGRKRRIEFVYDGWYDVIGRGMREFNKRIRKSHIWEGVELWFETPDGQRFSRIYDTMTCSQLYNR